MKSHRSIFFLVAGLIILASTVLVNFHKSDNIPVVFGQAGANQKITIEGLQTEGRGQQLELQSYQWGSASQSNLKQLTLSPPSSGIFNPKEITITKLVDGSSPELMVACFAGKEYPEMVLKASKIQENGSEVHYYTITFQNARVTSCGVEGDQTKYPVESLSFNFEKIVFTFIPEDGDPIVRGWDFKTKKELCLPPGSSTPAAC